MQIGKIVFKLIEYSFYLLFLITPLVFNPSRTLPSFELFEWNKMVLVYMFTVLIIGLWVMRCIIGSKVIFRRSPFDLPILLFFVSQLLSTLFSIDPHVSIYGYYSRFHGGLLSTICYSLLYFAFVSNRDLIDNKKLFISILTPAVLVAGYGIAERFGIDAHLWVQDVRNRVFSTLGQPNWLAAYLTIFLPIIASLFIHHLSHKKTGSKSMSTLNSFTPYHTFGHWFYLGITALFYVCLLFTKSRSGFLGFWIANGVFWIVLWWMNRHQVKKLLSALILYNAILLCLNFVILTPFTQYNRLFSIARFEQKSVVEHTAVPSGDSVLNSGVTDSADIRKIVWQGALKIARDYPLFGTGPETFAFAYYKYRPVEHNLTSEWDFLYNRAHNELLNILATSGIFGFFTYLIFLTVVSISTLIWLLKHREANSAFSEWLMVLGLWCGWISITITNFLGFSVVIVALYFYLIPAIIFAIRKPLHRPVLSTSSFHEPFQFVKILIPLLPMGILFFVIGNFWLADSYYARAISDARQGQFAEATKNIRQAIKIRADEPVYYDELGINLASMATMAIEANEATQGAELMQEAITVSGRALETSPQNVNFWKNRTKILFALSAYRPEFLDQSIAALDIALQLAPTDPKIIYNKAILLGHSGNNPEAIVLLKNALTMKPNYKDAYIALSIFYEEQNQISEAIHTIDEALEQVNPNDEELRQRRDVLSQKTL